MSTYTIPKDTIVFRTQEIWYHSISPNNVRNLKVRYIENNWDQINTTRLVSYDSLDLIGIVMEEGSTPFYVFRLPQSSKWKCLGVEQWKLVVG